LGKAPRSDIPLVRYRKSAIARRIVLQAVMKVKCHSSLLPERKHKTGPTPLLMRNSILRAIVCRGVISKKAVVMMKHVLAACALAASLVPVTAAAEPVNLKFSYFSSDRSLLYAAAVKPFTDAVNEAAKGVVHIDVHFSGKLGSIGQQAQLVQDGTADIAFIVPGYTPARFDNGVVELPGIFRDGREATLVYTRLIAAGALRGYEDFLVIGAFATPPETVHTRTPATSLADLKGARIRANNPVEVAALEKLGMTGVLMPVNQTADAIAAGKIEGAAIPASPLFEFGIGRFATNHYLLGFGVAPLAVVMNRKKFESLPEAAREVILKYAGEWTAARFTDRYEADNVEQVRKLREDPRRKVTDPSEGDKTTARAVFQSVTNEWLARDPRNAAILALAQAEIARLRASERASR
jgi:TRAP-type C4-dicarboxylate transport system substrate-binding protein